MVCTALIRTAGSLRAAGSREWIRSNSRRLGAALGILALVAAACGTGRPSPTDPLEAWDYVILGTSYSGQASWPEAYASFIEEDLGVEVVLHDQTVNAGRAAAAAERIRTDQQLRELIGQAELVTIGLAFDELREPMLSLARGECDAQCLRDVAPQIVSDWEVVLDEVLDLREPGAKIVAIIPGAWIIDYACGEWGSPCWEIGVSQLLEMYDSYAEAAGVRGFQVADTLTLLHAPGVLEAPVNPDYLKPDGLHLSDEASALIADLLRGLSSHPSREV